MEQTWNKRMDGLNRFIAKRSIRSLSCIVTALIAVPALILVLFLGLEQFQVKKGEISAQAMELARLFEGKHSDVVLHARTLMETLATSLGLAQLPEEVVRAQLKRLVEINPSCAYLTLADTNGFLRISSSSTDTSINFKDREQFQEALQQNRFSVGQVIISRTIGRPVLPFAVPIKNPEGQTSGVLLLGLHIEEYYQYFASLKIPEGGRLLLFDEKGTRLLRYPQRAASPIGRTINPPTWEYISNARSDVGVFEMPDQENLNVMYAFIKQRTKGLDQGYLGVLVGIPTPEWSNLFWPVFGRTALLVTLVMLLALVMHLFLFQKIIIAGVEALSLRAARIGKGDLSCRVEAPSGSREIMALWVAFERMAESLARDREARDSALQALRSESIRFRTLLETASDGVHILNQDGKLLMCSPSFAQMLGYSLEEMSGLSVADWDVVKQTEKIGSIIRGLLRSPRIFETRYRRKDGSEYDAEISVRGVELDGETLMYASARDLTERKETQRALQESEERLRAIYERSLDGVLISTIDGGVLKANPAAQEMFGMSEAEICARGRAGLVDLSDGRLFASLEELQRTGKVKGELRYRRKNGEIFEAEFASSRLPLASGAIASTVIRDITWRKQTEEALRRKHAMLSRTESIAHVGSWDWEVAEDKVTWSKELFNLFQLDPAQGAPPFAQQARLYHPEDLERLTRAAEETLSTGAPFELELRIYRFDGEMRRVLGRGFLDGEPGAKAPRMYGLLQDVTERKQAEQALRESEERYRGVFLSSEAIKLLVDPANGAIMDANPAAAEFYGYPLERLLKMYIFDLNVMPKEEALAMAREISTKQSGHYFFKHRLANGEIKDVEAYTSAILQNGRVLDMAAIHDITEFRRLEQIKADVERIFQHDLRTPLSGFVHIPHLLLEDENLSPKQRRMLRMVAASGRKLLSQVNCALELHKIETGKYRFRPAPCDPHRLILENVEILSMYLQVDPGMVLVTEHRLKELGSPLVLLTDEILLDVILMNLLRNALEASKAGERVLVNVFEEDKSLSIAISNAQVAPVEIRERFFEKYATAGKKGGTGLGTYSAAIMTRAIGGMISMETSEQFGTKVMVQLPKVS